MSVRRHSVYTNLGYTAVEPVVDKELADAEDSVENLSSSIYAQLHADHKPNFLEAINLDRDGGVDRVGNIWYSGRWIWSVFLFGSVAFNIAVLSSLNQSVFIALAKNMAMHNRQFLSGINPSDIHNMTKLSGELSEHVHEVTAGDESETGFIFKKYISDLPTRLVILSAASVVAIFEMFGICYYLLQILFCQFKFVYSKNEYQAYRSMHELMNYLLPWLSTFSAMKLMAKVHPALIYSDYLDYIEEAKYCKSAMGQFLLSAWFALTRILCACLALCAFATKMLVVSFKLINPNFQWITRISGVVGLLNNCMGIVLIEFVHQNRIFLFVFGGNDAKYQHRERALRNVYQCRVIKQIWTDFWQKGDRVKAIVMISTIDHYDLQALIIDAEHKPL